MSRLVILVLLLVPSVASAAPRLPPPRSADAKALRHWAGRPSDVPGGVVYSRGEVIVTDSPFDDAGADTADNRDPGEDVPDSQFPGANAALGNAGPSTGGPEGDFDYPAKLANAADIVETRLAAGARAWFLLVRFNALRAGVGVQARVGGHQLLVRGGRATFDGRAVPAVASLRRSLVAVRVPRRVFDPGRATLPVFVASRLGEQLVDLAYVPREGYDSYWRDRVQSADIAASSFDGDAVMVDFGALRGCPCPAADVAAHGLLTRVFRSGQRLGRGISAQSRFDQDQGTYPPNLYRSPTQPYAVYVPKHPTGATVVLLHFLGGNYMSYPLTSFPGVAEWAEKLGTTVVMPEGRGEGGWYQGEAETDVFEALRDATGHYRVDPDRVYLAGMSMGGFGTWRLAQLYPDRFARAIVWAGPIIPDTVWAYPAPPSGLNCPADKPDCQYSLTDLFGNTRNLPVLVVHGGSDDLVPASGAEHWMDEYARRSGATFRYRFYPDRTHETSFPGTTGALVEDWLGGLPRRAHSPARVTYTVRRGIGTVGRGAYWVSGLRLARGLATGRIDASRAAAADRIEPVGPELGADALGGYRLTGADVTAAPAVPGHLSLVATGLRRAVVRVTGSVRLTGSTDRPLTLVLRHGATRRVLHLPAGPLVSSFLASRGGAVR